MSADVVSLSDVSKDGWNAGAARCIACGHEWEAVAKAGTAWLECPNCKAKKGIYKFACAPQDGEVVWQCRCGSEVLYATPKALRCCNCGAVQRPFDA